jgi:hypothetical protein
VGYLLLLVALAAIAGLMLGHAMVWEWREVGEHFGAFVCFGLGSGSVMSLPVMTMGLVASERRALLALLLGTLAVGIVCWLTIWIICWSFLHIT